MVMAFAKGRNMILSMIEDEALIIESLIEELQSFFNDKIEIIQNELKIAISGEDDDVASSIKQEYANIESIYEDYSEHLIGMLIQKVYSYAESNLERLMQLNRYRAKKIYGKTSSDIIAFYDAVSIERSLSKSLLEFWPDYKRFHELRKKFVHNKDEVTNITPSFEFVRSNLGQVLEMLRAIERTPISSSLEHKSN